VFATGVAVYGIQYAAPEPPEELELLPLEELELELLLDEELLEPPEEDELPDVPDDEEVLDAPEEEELLELLEDEELVEVPDEDALLESVLTATSPQPASSAETRITTHSDAPARGVETICAPLRKTLIRLMSTLHRTVFWIM